ncbi:MAG: pyridoxal-phosphate dependent enzyme [Flavobacteriaceae bacterium]
MTLFASSKSSINFSLDSFEGYQISIKREDLLHPIVSGNKFRKLKYNFLKFSKQKQIVVLTFGGAFSNHLAATAFAGKESKVQTIGIVRGEEWKTKISQSSTLDFCQAQGMQLYFVSREAYRQKEASPLVQTLIKKEHNLKILPEGGTNALAVKGCMEILTPEDQVFDTICCCVGTGGTLAGLIESAAPTQKLVGFSALNNPNLALEVKKYTSKTNWHIQDHYTFGGYAKYTLELIQFINAFYQQYQIPLDPIYTGKMLFGIFDLIKTNQWVWKKKILVIHSGGLQGIHPMNLQLQKKGLPQLLYSSD